MSRKRLYAVLALLAVVVTGCGGTADAGATLSLDAALPTTVPDGTKIVVGDPTTEVALKLSGQIDKAGQLFAASGTTEGACPTADRRRHWRAPPAFPRQEAGF